MDPNNFVRAKYAYEPQNADELSFIKNDFLEILKRDEDDWWEARLITSDARGWIPTGYVRPLKEKEFNKIKRSLRKSPKEDVEEDDKSPVRSTLVENNSFPSQTCQNWFKKVYAEVIEDSKRYLRDVELIRTNCAKVRESFDKHYAVSKLEASSDKLRGVENRIVEQFQNDSESENAHVGAILNESMEEYKIVYESYYTYHPAAVDALRREHQQLAHLDLNQIRSSWAKPLLRLENFPLRLRDLEKYYSEADEDGQLLARTIYQIEEVLLPKCHSIRKNKDLELAILQQPIRNWTGDSIDELGSLRVMIPLSIRAVTKTLSGFGLVFSSAIVLITATDRMSGFVLVANIPKSKLAVSRTCEKCVETTGPAGHFWFDFESKEETDEWWGAMEALNVTINRPLPPVLHPSDRSSFSEVKTGTQKRGRTSQVPNNQDNLTVDRRGNRSNSGSPFAVMAPVKHVPIRPSRKPDYAAYSQSPPLIKPCPSSSTISTIASSFSARPTPPYRATSPKPARSKDRKSKSFKSKTPEHQIREARPNPRDNSVEVMGIYEAYNSNRRRKTSDPQVGRISQAMPQSLQPQMRELINKSLEDLIAPFKQEFKEKIEKLTVRVDQGEQDIEVLRATVRATKNNLSEEQATRRRLEAKIQAMLSSKNSVDDLSDS